MNKRTMLAQRRQALLAQSAAQRDLIASHGHALTRSLSWLDKGVTLLNRAKKPALLAGAISLLGIMVFKRQRLLPLLSKGFVTWQTLRRAAPVLQNIIARYRQ